MACSASESSGQHSNKPPWRHEPAAEQIMDSDEERAEHNRRVEVVRERKRNNGFPKLKILKPDRSAKITTTPIAKKMPKSPEKPVEKARSFSLA